MKLAIDKAALESIVQQMQSGMIVGPVLAQELAALVAAAKPATDPDLVADMALEIQYFGQCRGKVHGERAACDCRFCRIMKKIATAHSQEYGQ